MIPYGSEASVTVSNRQRRLKVDSQWLVRIATSALNLVHGTGSQLSIALVSDAAMARLNVQYHATRARRISLVSITGKGRVS